MGMDKTMVVYSYNEIVLSNKHVQIDPHNHMDANQKYFAHCEKPACPPPKCIL